jgi:hypothetical protein
MLSPGRPECDFPDTRAPNFPRRRYTILSGTDPSALMANGCVNGFVTSAFRELDDCIRRRTSCAASDRVNSRLLPMGRRCAPAEIPSRELSHAERAGGLNRWALQPTRASVAAGQRVGGARAYPAVSGLRGRPELRYAAGLHRDPLERRRISGRHVEPRRVSALVGVVPRPDAEPARRHLLQSEPDADGGGSAGDRGPRRARPGDRRILPADPATQRKGRLSSGQPDRRNLEPRQSHQQAPVLARQPGRAGSVGA